MKALPTVVLRPGEADRVVAGHPWIYEGSVLRLSAPATDGSVVQVKDHRHRLLGIGFYNSRSKIKVRMLAPERVAVDQQFFAERIRRALAVRQRHLPEASSYRAVNSEGDLLSGLVVDRYENVLVVQISSLGMDLRKDQLVGALKAVLDPHSIIERSDMAARRFDGLPLVQGVLCGEASARVPVRLNGLRFEADLQAGHKTGLYLDQQVNYRLVAEMVARIPGAEVLDCFCFQGGFALHAARAGAAHVHGVDQSEEAVQDAGRFASANGLEARCSFEAANVFNWLKAHTTAEGLDKTQPRFDAIILDPPSFTRSRSTVMDALRGYKEIHLRALKLLKRGGTLATFCCSHHVDAGRFQDVILAAAFDARRWLRRVASFTQAPDHPVLPAVPETEYLKGYAFEVIR